MDRALLAASGSDAAMRADMAALVRRRLVAAGYVRIGLHHYARCDDALAKAAGRSTLRRNFQGYVADESPWVIGIGASAISSLPSGFCQNTPDPS
jgi:oxygen-independent coproporphyrinogen III oxidase